MSSNVQTAIRFGMVTAGTGFLQRELAKRNPDMSREEQYANWIGSGFVSGCVTSVPLFSFKVASQVYRQSPPKTFYRNLIRNMAHNPALRHEFLRYNAHMTKVGLLTGLAFAGGAALLDLYQDHKAKKASQ